MNDHHDIVARETRTVVHPATPFSENDTKCVLCGGEIKRIASTWIHADTQLVAGPNPPLNADHIHVLLDCMTAYDMTANRPWRDYDGDENDDPKVTREGYLRTYKEARKILGEQLNIL